MARGRREFIKSVQGKVLDRIVVDEQDDCIQVEVRFQDNTSCNIRFAAPQVEITEVDLLGWRKGNSRVIRKLL